MILGYSFGLSLILEILGENKNVEGTTLGAGKTELNMLGFLL